MNMQRYNRHAAPLAAVGRMLRRHVEQQDLGVLATGKA